MLKINLLIYMQFTQCFFDIIMALLALMLPLAALMHSDFNHGFEITSKTSE